MIFKYIVYDYIANYGYVLQIMIILFVANER